jgi:uncharacterized protein YcbK (DUF882 family)
MKLKRGVIINNIKTEIVYAIYVADKIYAKHGYELTITSALDGKHSKKSLHYEGLAIDFRTRDIIKSHLQQIIGQLEFELGNNYDVVLEIDHLHVEFDPSTGG